MSRREIRRKYSSRLLCLAAASVAMNLWLAGAASATDLGVNLITNGDGEANAGAGNFTSVVTPAGWTTTGNFTVVQYSAGGANDLRTDVADVVNGGGANYFAGGPGTAAGVSTASQTIDISDLGASVANGFVGTLQADLGGWLSQADNMKVALSFFRGDGGMIAETTLGPVTAADRSNTTQLQHLFNVFAIPSGTASVQVKMVATGGNASQYNDGYADNLSLSLTDHWTAVWTGDNGNQWKDGANWFQNSAPSNSAYDVEFGNHATDSVLVGGDRAAGKIRVRSGTSLMLGTGTLTLYSTDADSVAVNGGSSLTVAPDLTLNSGGAQLAGAGTGTGTINVSAGANWTSSGTIQVGGNGSSGSLNVGGSVRANAVGVAAGSTNAINLQGGTLTADTASIDGALTGRGTLAAATSAGVSSAIIVAGGPLTIGSASSTSGFSSAGAVNVGSETLTLLDADAAVLTGPLTVSGGTINAANGLTLGGSGVTHSLGGIINGPVTVLAGSGVTLNADLTAGDPSSPTGFSSAGDLGIGPYTFTPLTAGSPTLTGRLTMAGGTFVAPSGLTLPNTPTPHSLRGTITGSLDVPAGTSADVTGTLNVGGSGLDLAGSMSLAGGTLHAAGVRISGSGTITGRGLIFGHIDDLTPGQTGLVPQYGNDRFDSVDVGAGEVTLLGEGAVGTRIDTLTIAGGTFHVVPVEQANDRYSVNLTGYGTLEGTAWLDSATITGPTTMHAAGLSGTVNVGPNALVVQDVDGSSPDALIDIMTGSVHILHARDSVQLLNPIKLAGGSFTSDVPWNGTPSGAIFEPISISGFGYVSAPGLGRVPLPVATVSGGSIPTLPVAQLDDQFVLSVDPVHVQPGSALAGGAVYAPGGIVLDNADTITGSGVVMGHVTDNTGGAGGLHATGPLADGTLYVPGGDSYLLATNAPTVSLTNQNATTPSHLYAANGLVLGSTGGTAPIHVHADNLTFASTATIGVDTTLHSSFPVPLSHQVTFALQSTLQSEKGLVPPSQFFLTGEGTLRGPLVSAAGSTKLVSDLRVTGDVTVDLSGVADAPVFDDVQVGSLSNGASVTHSRLTVAAPAAPRLDLLRIYDGEFNSAAGLYADTTWIDSPSPANPSAVRTPFFAGASGAGGDVLLNGSVDLRTDRIDGRVTVRGPGTQYIHPYTGGTRPAINGPEFSADGVFIVPQGLTVSADTVLEPTYTSTGSNPESRIVGALRYDGTASHSAASGVNRPIIVQGSLTGNGTYNVPVQMAAETSYSTTLFGGLSFATSSQISPGDFSASGHMTFNDGLDLLSSPAVTLNVSGTDRGVTYDAIDASQINGHMSIYIPGMPAAGPYRLVSVSGSTAGLSASLTMTNRNDYKFATPADSGGHSILLLHYPTDPHEHYWFTDSNNGSGTGGVATQLWVTAGSALGSGTGPDQPGDTARFLDVISAPRTITLYGTHVAGLLQFDTPYGYTFNGYGEFDLDSTSGPAVIDVRRGTHSFGRPIVLHDDAVMTLAAGTAFTLFGPGSIDVGNHALTITGAGDRSGYPALIAAAYHGGAWDLPGITSSAAAADSDHLAALGYADDGTALSIRLTSYGDANLDGVVNADDYALLDRAFARALTDPEWTDGDFNYDGAVTSDDYLLIDTTLGHAQGLSPAFLSTRQAQFGDAYVSALLASIPEPSSLACLSAAIPLLTRRRGPKSRQR